jgi:hypothetical protein
MVENTLFPRVKIPFHASPTSMAVEQGKEHLSYSAKKSGFHYSLFFLLPLLSINAWSDCNVWNV